MLSLLVISAISLLLGVPVLGSPDASYEEKLYLTQFADAKVLAEFYFTRTITSKGIDQAQDNHYTLLPRSIGEVVQSFGVQELHLTFTQGQWNHEKWSYSPLSAANGVQLWAWFQSTSVDSQWKGLTHALAGLFCASLNEIDMSVTAEPLLSFRPEGASKTHNESEANMKLRYGSLPREAVCTENLTPWAKLLPCQTKAGIASLFNAYRLFDGNFHSMGTHVRPICLDSTCSQTGMEFVQTLSVVLDPLRLENRKDWSLQSLFQRKINLPCPLSDDSKVLVTVPNQEGFTFRPSPASTKVEESGRTTALYIVNEGLEAVPIINRPVLTRLHQDLPRNTDIGVSWTNGNVEHGVNRTESYIRAHRYLTGYGGERGGIAVDLHNYHPISTQAIRYFESVPWFLKLYLHTLKVETTAETDIVKAMYFQPAIDRGRPSVLEMTMELPPNSTTTLSIDFDKAFVKYTEHPPDANRGFDIGAAVISLESEDGPIRMIHTETLLISLPTPDFSMPYNVITLTCTLMALFFGSMFNMLTRRYEPLVLKN